MLHFKKQEYTRAYKDIEKIGGFMDKTHINSLLSSIDTFEKNRKEVISLLKVSYLENNQ